MISFGKKGMWEFVYSLVQNFATNYILLLKLVYIMLENTPEVVKRASFLAENKISLSRLPENLRTSFYKTSGIHGPFTQLIRDSAFEAKTPSNTSRSAWSSAGMGHCRRGGGLRDGAWCRETRVSWAWKSWHRWKTYINFVANVRIWKYFQNFL